MRDSIDPGDHRFFPQVVGDVDERNGFTIQGWDATVPRRGRILTLAEGQLLPRSGSINPSRSAISRWWWRFRAVRGGIDPGDHRFCPQVVGGAHEWKGSMIRNATSPTSGATERRRWPEGQWTTLAVRWLYEPRSISDQPRRVGFSQSVAWCVDPGDHCCFRSRVVGVIDVWKGFCYGNGYVPSPGVAGPRRWPER